MNKCVDCGRKILEDRDVCSLCAYERKKEYNRNYMRNYRKERSMKISVTYSRTINLGNFNSMRAEAGMEFDLAQGVDLNSTSLHRDYDLAWGIVRSQVEEQIKKEQR